MCITLTMETFVIQSVKFIDLFGQLTMALLYKLCYCLPQWFKKYCAINSFVQSDSLSSPPNRLKAVPSKLQSVKYVNSLLIIVYVSFVEQFTL